MSLNNNFLYASKLKMISEGREAAYTDWELNSSVVPPGRIDSNAFYVNNFRLDCYFLLPRVVVFNRDSGVSYEGRLMTPLGYDLKLLEVYQLLNGNETDFTDYINPPGIYQAAYDQPLLDIINALQSGVVGNDWFQIWLAYFEVNNKRSLKK